MTCKTPLFRLPRDGLSSHALEAAFDRRFGSVSAKVVSSLDLPELSKVFGLDSFQQVRCGKCIGCRISAARDWAIRCCHESECYDHNYFVTTTYSDPFLPRGVFLKDARTGEVTDTSLVPSDATNFVKRLRQNLLTRYDFSGLRVYYVGEYGDLLDRPHYHFLLFNMPDLFKLDDLTWLKRQGSFDIWRSDLIERSWTYNPSRNSDGVSMGFCTVQDFSYDTAAYCAQYVTKKLDGHATEFNLSDTPVRQQPFSRMSRRPGIGAPYLTHDKLEDIALTDKVFYRKKEIVFESRPPRYYDKLFDVATGGEYGSYVEDNKKKSFSLHSKEFLRRSSRRRDLTTSGLVTNLALFKDLEARALKDDAVRVLRLSRKKRCLE